METQRGANPYSAGVRAAETKRRRATKFEDTREGRAWANIVAQIRAREFPKTDHATRVLPTPAHLQGDAA